MKRHNGCARKALFEQLETRVVFSADPMSAVLASLSSMISQYSIDGSGNNVAHPDWGSAGSDLLRIAAAAYGDGVSTPAGASRPSAREISNTIVDQGNADIINDGLMSAMVYAWGQFIDHDIGLTPSGSEAFNVKVPTGDPSFDPKSTGTQTIPLNRSIYDALTGVTDPRQQINVITAWIDGSMVYGSNTATAAALRTFSGGRLKTSAGNLLPLNDAATLPGGTLSMANDAHLVPDSQLFAAGDVRANENVELTALQTLFVREHNYWADKIHAADASLSDEQIYQRARAIVIAEIQSITYNSWLPAVLGRGAITPYQGYDSSVDPQLANEFSTAAFRFGHSMLGDDVEFLNNQGLEVADAIPLAGAFFNPPVIEQLGIDPLLKYLSSDPASEIDTKVVESVRNFLFGPPGSGGLDLASLNIQRGRDHGLADYNTVRAAYGLPKVKSFADITANPDLQAKLKQLFGSVDNIDLWVGALAEDHVAGASVGNTLRTIIANQFERLRDGDRFFYQNVFSGKLLRQIDSTTLADVIQRNTTVKNLQDNTFFFRAAIAGNLYVDANRDGRLSRGERGMGGQTVQLIDATSGEVIVTTTTDRQGIYNFGVLDGLRTGKYQVACLPSGMSATPITTRILSITRGDKFLVADIPLAGSIMPPPTTDPPPCNTPGGKNGGQQNAPTPPTNSPSMPMPGNPIDPRGMNPMARSGAVNRKAPLDPTVVDQALLSSRKM